MEVAAITDYKIATAVGTPTEYISYYCRRSCRGQLIMVQLEQQQYPSLEAGNRYTITVSARNGSSGYGSEFITKVTSTLLFGCTSSTAINYNADATNSSSSATCIEPLTANSSLTSFSTLTIARGHLVSGGALQTLIPSAYNSDLASINLTNANTSGQPQVIIKRGNTNTTVDVKSIASGSSGAGGAVNSYVQFNLRDTGSTTTTIQVYITHPTTKNTYIWSFQDSLSGNGLTGNAYQPNGISNNWQWVGIISGVNTN